MPVDDAPDVPVRDSVCAADADDDDERETVGVPETDDEADGVVDDDGVDDGVEVTTGDGKGSANGWRNCVFVAAVAIAVHDAAPSS